MIDTFDKIKPLLVFDSHDDFYHLQILKRKKENPELGSNSEVIKTYYISSVEYFEKKYPEIKELCTITNARASLNLNRRSFEKIAFQVLRKTSEQIFNRDFFSVRKVYESCCGVYSNEPNKKWIIDIDEKDMVLVNDIQRYIDTIEPVGNKTYIVLPTKSGYHIITKPFRLDKFKQKYPDIDIHKDNPINVFIS